MPTGEMEGLKGYHTTDGKGRGPALNMCHNFRRLSIAQPLIEEQIRDFVVLD
jgi:hypothetical protein